MKQVTNIERRWITAGLLCPNPADGDRGYNPLTGVATPDTARGLRVGVDYIGVPVTGRKPNGGAR